MISTQNNARLENELIIENYRQLNFPTKTSRLTGMYFFEDEETAELACSWGGHFSLNNLSRLDLHPTTPFSRHDSNWITYAELDQHGRIENDTWINKYWSGDCYPGKKPVWEIIMHGRAVVRGHRVRQLAYNKISVEFNNCVSLLEISRVAANLGSDLGNCCAWAIRQNDDLIKLSYFVDMRDAENEEFLNKVRQDKSPRNHKDLAVGGDQFGVPHFGIYNCEFSVRNGFSNNFLSSVHLNLT